MKQNLSATVFVIDDDPVVLRRLTKEYLRETNLGVLTAETLPSAVSLLEGDFSVGAILADLHFRPETQDQKRNIRSGFDFINYVRHVRPTLPVYVMSMDIDDRTSRDRAKEMGLNVREWYDKMRPQASQFSPWVRIERDLILQALRSEPDFREKAIIESGENATDLLRDEHVAEKVQHVFNYPRLTYLQYLEEDCGYQLRKPIEVHCWPQGDVFRANAVRIPLLLEALGEDPVEAIDHLAEILVSEKAALDSEDPSHVSGYARYVNEQLNAYLERAPAMISVQA